MKIIDALKKDCPIPVVLAKKQLDNGVFPLNILVDNEIAVKNLEKLAKSYNLHFNCSSENNIYSIIFSSEKDVKIAKSTKNTSNFVLFVTKNYIGTNNELGYKLFDMMLYSYIENESFPSHILLINEGVKANILESSCQYLKLLEQNNTEILSCGACANFYDIQDKINIGDITNMFEITSILDKSTKVITI